MPWAQYFAHQEVALAEGMKDRQGEVVQEEHPGTSEAQVKTPQVGIKQTSW